MAVMEPERLTLVPNVEQHESACITDPLTEYGLQQLERIRHLGHSFISRFRFLHCKAGKTGGGSNHIAFIVRNDASNSDLYLQFPDATWQAYNGYGGNSMYDGNTSLAGRTCR